MPEERLRCQVCDALNNPGEKYCEVCGVELKVAAKPSQAADLDNLLADLIETKPEEKPPGAKAEVLDIEEDIVDELLDSLVVPEERKAAPAPAVQEFECPICGASVAENAPECPQCHTSFAPIPEPAKPAPPRARPAPAAPAPAAPPPAPIEMPPMEVPVAVAVTEEDVSKVRVASGRLIDFVVAGTIAGLLLAFLAFRMYSLEAITANPISLVVFLGIMGGGLVAGLVLFQVTTSAIAQGDRLVKEGRYEDALLSYDRAIRMGSKPSSAWTSKGVALKRLGKFEEALRCHNLALRLDPKNEIAWCNRGDIYFRTGQLERAIECYDKAVEIRPRYAIAWNNKGAALARMSRFQEARKCHDRAIRLRPKYVAAWLNLSEVLARMGDRAAAEKCLQRARTLSG